MIPTHVGDLFEKGGGRSCPKGVGTMSTLYTETADSYLILQRLDVYIGIWGVVLRSTEQVEDILCDSCFSLCFS